MMSLLHIENKEVFQKEVLESDKVALVDFWAPWCGPCRMVGPVVEEVAAETVGNVIVGKINVDEEPGLAQSFRVMSIPTLVVMKDGKVASSQVGAKSKQAILEMLK